MALFDSVLIETVNKNGCGNVYKKVVHSVRIRVHLNKVYKKEDHGRD